MEPVQTAKRDAAVRAFELIEPGMVLGLGTGSTVEAGLPYLAERLGDGLQVTCVSSSNRTTAAAARHGIELVELAAVGRVDLAIDGADQVDGRGVMVKGGGGAHLREKCLAAAATQRVFIVDGSKRVERVGRIWLPLEILPYGADFTLRAVAELVGGKTRLREDSSGPLWSDNGNLLADCWIEELPEPRALDDALHRIPGVLATGLFLDLLDLLIVADGGEVSIERFAR